MQSHPLKTLVSALVFLSLGLGGCSRQTAEEKGVTLATEKIDLVKGVGGALEQKGGEAAESVTTGLGKVMHGVQKGIERSGRSLVTSAGLEQAGLQVTKVQDPVPGPNGAEHGLEAYVIASKACDGVLLVKAFDAMEREVARARVSLQQSADDARYVHIPLDARVILSTITKVVVDFQPKSPG